MYIATLKTWVLWKHQRTLSQLWCCKITAVHCMCDTTVMPLFLTMWVDLHSILYTHTQPTHTCTHTHTHKHTHMHTHVIHWRGRWAMDPLVCSSSHKVANNMWFFQWKILATSHSTKPLHRIWIPTLLRIYGTLKRTSHPLAWSCEVDLNTACPSCLDYDMRLFQRKIGCSYNTQHSMIVAWSIFLSGHSLNLPLKEWAWDFFLTWPSCGYPGGWLADFMNKPPVIIGLVWMLVLWPDSTSTRPPADRSSPHDLILRGRVTKPPTSAIIECWGIMWSDSVRLSIQTTSH